MKEAQLGNTLTEYGLIGTMIALASIVGLSVLGKDLNGQFGHVAAGAPSTMSLLDAPAKVTPVIKLPTNTGNGNTPSNTTPSSSSSTAFNNNGLPTNATYQDLANSVQTTGANGTTNVLADSLVSLAKQQLANGTITQTQYNQLVGLANKGYTIAQIEAQVESAGNNTNISNMAYSSTSVQYNGTSTTISALAASLGFDHTSTMFSNSGTLQSDPLNSTQGAGTALTDFLSAYQSIASNGSQLNPLMSIQLQALASEIVTISDAVSLTAGDRGQMIFGTNDFTGDLVNKLSSYTPSQVTSQDSSQICTMGSGQTSGSNCTTQ